MERVKGIKLLWAILLALAVFAPAPIRLPRYGPNQPQSELANALWAWSYHFSIAIPIIAVAVITGILLQPRRPGRLAVILAFVGFLAIAFPMVFGKNIGRMAWGNIFDRLYLSLRAPSFGGLRELFRLAREILLPLMIACWIGSEYWKSDSWKHFWKGRGGIIIKAGLIAGLIFFSLAYTNDWYQDTIIRPRRIAHLAATGMLRMPYSLTPFDWAFLAIFRIKTGIMSALTVAALLVKWRPKPFLGAFAGSGLALGLVHFWLVVYRLALSLEQGAGVRISYSLVHLLFLALLGAIAGIYAGRWTEEGIDKQAERSGTG